MMAIETPKGDSASFRGGGGGGSSGDDLKDPDDDLNSKGSMMTTRQDSSSKDSVLSDHHLLEPEAFIGRPEKPRKIPLPQKSMDNEELGRMDSMPEEDAAFSNARPILFERASKTWWNPTFESRILEQQFTRSLMPWNTRRFQLGLIYMTFLAGAMGIYSVMEIEFWLAPLITSILTLLITLGVLLVTFVWEGIYKHFYYHISCLVAVTMITASCLCNVSQLSQHWAKDLSSAVCFNNFLIVVLLIYTVLPLNFHTTALLATGCSVAFETIMSIASTERIYNLNHVVVNMLLHLCIHTIGCHIKITMEVRMRDTFMKVAQSAMFKKQLVAEKALKEKMIHSVMPPKVANWLMKGHAEDVDEGGGGGTSMFPIASTVASSNDLGKEKKKDPTEFERNHDNDNLDGKSNCSSTATDMDFAGSSLRMSPRSSNPLVGIFRPFNMNTMDNVSILFADIVGFTKMSSNKTASQLVGLLNDLFGRFDSLCTECSCEKISTLGDCYYCVSGCPEPTLEHATNCVEMGLAMISAIKEFDEDRHESVNMRVGIHTGTVLCGIVGKTRFKFDVWSNDVNFANKMESTGKPGQVHISEKTHRFLKNDYLFDEGEMLNGLKTYFIRGRVALNIDRGESKTAPIIDQGQNLVLHTEAINAQMAKSLPSLSSYLNGRGRNAVISMAPDVEVEAAGLEQNGNDNRKGQAYSDDNGLANGPKVNTFKSATQKYSMLPTNAKKKRQKMNTNAVVKDNKGIVQTQVSLPETQDNCANLLNRRYSSSLPTLPPASQDLFNRGQDLLPGGSKMSSKMPNPTTAFADSDSEWKKEMSGQDVALIACIQEDKSHEDYFTSPPFKSLSLFFEESRVEKEYRKLAWKGLKPIPPPKLGRNSPPIPTPKTISPALFDAYFDITLVVLVFASICIDCFWSYKISTAYVAYFLLATSFLVAGIYVMYKNLNKDTVEKGGKANSGSLHHSLYSNKERNSLIKRIYSWCRGWVPSHCLGSLLLALPMMGALSNFNCDLTHHSNDERSFYLQLIFVSLTHFSNLSSLNHIFKSSLATLFAVLVVVLYSNATCDHSDPQVIMGTDDDEFVLMQTMEERHRWFSEVVMCILTLTLYIWLINREFEISYRLSYHCSKMSQRDRRRIQSLKNQADWLLHNIIPRHVAEYLKKSASYSENHKEVGVIFASIVNFNELYEESYMGGKEYLRVLNELISDFDEILQRAEYQNVEKIKTIGSTFMAASGMNPAIRQNNTHKYAHLHELTEFALELQRSVYEFNQSLIEFDLVVRVGMNFGDVTAGVIGTTKLYYDIWGDSVNIASRMDSTGVQGRIQVPERCMHVLSEWYTFELRGPIFVKGKDNMITYLLVGRKPDAFVNAVSSIIPQYAPAPQ